MTKGRVTALLLVLAAIAGGAWWWSQRHRDRKPTTSHAEAQGSAANTAAVVSGDPHAHAIVVVTDARGPIEGATIRLAASDGDATIARTGRDGTASADLEPGMWTVSASARDHEPAAAAVRELHAGETARYEIRLGDGGRVLAGIVTDALGGPVAGARIDAAKLGGRARPSDAVAATTTGADGRYALAVSEGQLLVAASDPAYAPQSRYVEVGPNGATADFKLVPGGVIEGRVVDEHSGDAVPGAKVEARRDAPALLLGEAAQHHVTADGDGHFRITGLRPGAIELAANAGPRMSRKPTHVGLGVAEQVTGVTILVGTGPVIRGIVIDETGAPAADVSIRTYGASDNGQAKSDAKGAFVLEGLPPGRYQLEGGSDKFVAAGTTSVELATLDVDGVRVKVQHGPYIKGHVEPRQSCDVSLELDDRASTAQQIAMAVAPATTGDDGEFSLGPVSAATYTVAARCGSGDQGAQAVTVTTTAPEVIVRVTPGASIAGRVVDHGGKPLAAMTVMVSPMAETERTTIVNGMVTSGIQGVTSASGAFELRGLAAGSYQLHVLDRGRPLPMRSPVNIALAATDHKTGVELVVDRPDGAIRGTVTGPDGQPLADAWVSVHQDIGDLLAGVERPDEGGSHSRTVTVENTDDGGGAGEIAPALTDASGRFEISGLPRVPWTVVAEAKGGALRGSAARVVPDATITVQALGLSTLSGTVHPVPPSFAVELDGPTRATRSFAAADGTFSFDRLDPGTYVVRVTSSAGNGEATVQVATGQPASVDVALNANAIVVGKLVDAGGKPLGAAPLAIVPDSGDGKVSVSLSGPPPESEADGSFRLEAKAGPSVLVVLVQPRPVTKPGLALVAGQTFDAGTIIVASGPPPNP